MTLMPAFPVKKYEDRPPFLNDGTSKLEFISGATVPGPAHKPIPAVIMNFKVLESSNPMNGVGQTHTVRIECKGFDWGENVQNIVHAISLLPKAALSPEAVDAVFQTGRLKGRKVMLEQTRITKPTGMWWNTFKAAAVETTPAI